MDLAALNGLNSSRWQFKVLVVAYATNAEMMISKSSMAQATDSGLAWLLI
jgi:hypothetical protein